MAKRFVRTLSRAVDNIVLLTLLVCLILAGYALWDTHQMLNAADAAQFTEYKPTSEKGSKSFEQLRAMNPDVIGWLTIYDTTIDYPVVRSPKSNDDYLSKNAEGEWEGSGSLFLDHQNKADFSDFNTIIFGHHMAGPAMFGEIDAFLNTDYFEKHEYANLFFSDAGLELVQSTPSNGTTTGLIYEFMQFQGRDHGLQMFAMIQADGHDSCIYRVPATTVAARKTTLKTIADKAIQVRNLKTGEVKQVGKAGASKVTKIGNVDPSFFGVTENDRIVLMSTCSAEITNGRFVLCAKLLDEPVPNPFPEEKEARTILGIDVDKVLNTMAKLPLWQWLLLLIALILLIGLLYYAERYRLKKKQERKLKKQEIKEVEKNDE